MLIFAEPLLTGLGIGGGLVVFFCGMSFVFLVCKRQKNVEPKANTPNADEKLSGQNAGKIYE